MTDQQKIIRLAEFCGWKKVDLDAVHVWQAPNGDGRCQQFLPDFLADLNACEEFQRLARKRGLWAWWVLELELVICVAEGTAHLPACHKSSHETRRVFAYATATAAQRCEAMLAVLEANSSIENGNNATITPKEKP